MKNLFILTIIIISSTTILFSQEQLDIDGALLIENSEDTIPATGTIRWTGLNFEGYNGYAWTTLTSFKVTQIITDVDGNEYRTITIGNQEWMAQNLRTSKYSNGDAIMYVTNSTDWGNLASSGYCWYDNDSSYEDPYGKLYNWYAVNDSRGLCPTGWHEPTKDEWSELFDFLGGINFAGGKMKETETTHWNYPNTGATNMKGFTGLPGGQRASDGGFHNINAFGYLWTSTSFDTNNAWGPFIRSTAYNVVEGVFDKRVGTSVRCVMD